MVITVVEEIMEFKEKERKKEEKRKEKRLYNTPNHPVNRTTTMEVAVVVISILRRQAK